MVRMATFNQLSSLIMLSQRNGGAAFWVFSAHET